MEGAGVGLEARELAKGALLKFAGAVTLALPNLSGSCRNYDIIHRAAFD